ncbi:FeS assembly protein SufD [Synechococcus sp. PCC 7502]|uniref:Fe-S cluster assembly protein SufD n=1 Tax=Synechococcus sp. PCC 7502 TaxID=1173263 RepID=UPI00029FDE6D|nr:Fe-S cluster assembly protein SufD [Synechococcus sp. PCC 7502]AFY72303.1 FeS assembly protein SufD [Synechococcus sp. PCC 7502]
MIDLFAQDLLSQQPSFDHSPAWLRTLRSEASDRLNYLKFPTPKDEEWRNNDFSELRDIGFALVNAVDKSEDPITNPINILDAHILPESAESLITFIDGRFSIEFSALEGLPTGVFIGSLNNFNHLGIDLTASLSPHLGKYADAEDFFVALNTASIDDVAVVYIPKNLNFIPTVQLLFASHQNTISQPRCLVIVESGGSLNLVETHIGQDSLHFCNSVTEIYVGANARINHTKVQTESDQAIWISNCAIVQQRSSAYIKNSIVLGAKKSRTNLHIQQLGEHTETSLNGLTLIGGEQIADTHSQIAHNFPNGTSQQLHKCIADERSHCIFNGKILVSQAAQLTNSKQLSRNLLLSPKARIDTKPQLEIFADNVKCAHGATISQIDADELFYLQSRCIDLESAKKLLTYAFAAEVITQIPVDSLRESLSQLVLAKTH